MELNSYTKGLWAEFFAAVYFCLKGYRPLSCRFKTPVGEIDLIAKRGNTLVFIEVKMRQNAAAAGEAINAKNQSRVRRAAELYLQRYPEYNNCVMRFDALLLAPYVMPQHIKNAF